MSEPSTDMHWALEIARNGNWLSRGRVRLIAVAILVASIAGLLFLALTAHGIIDRQGRPIGTDFSDVYAAGSFVLDGNPEAPFDLPAQYAREQAIFGQQTPFYGWHYPPYFLFIAGALAKMSYPVALAVWQASTLALYLLMIWAIVSAAFPQNREGSARTAQIRGNVPALASPSNQGPAAVRPTGRSDYLWLLLALAYPATLINIGHGQNGFLTAALLGGALVLLDQRPLIAGTLIGFLVYKPQFGVMLPLALIAGGHWRTFISAVVTVVLLTLATSLAFGPEVWHAFLLSTKFSRTVVLEEGNIGWEKIQSLFSWARMWGAPIPLAYALQGALTLALGTAIVGVWRASLPSTLKGASLCFAAVLATPYSLDYDMMVLAPGIAFYALDGIERGFRPWEKTALATVWLAPLVARSVAHVMLIPLGVPAMLAVFLLLLRRAGFDGAFTDGFRPRVVCQLTTKASSAKS